MSDSVRLSSCSREKLLRSVGVYVYSHIDSAFVIVDNSAGAVNNDGALLLRKDIVEDPCPCLLRSKYLVLCTFLSLICILLAKATMG